MDKKGTRIQVTTNKDEKNKNFLDFMYLKKENIKKEEIFKAKEEIMKSRDELDKEIRERRSEVRRRNYR